MSSRKRKDPPPPKDGSETSRAERKRVQNRISQKCHRERQAAHARHLESVVGIMKISDQDGDNATDRYTALLQQHMKVIEEKRELEEAIFRMRKKLLSISNSAAAAADDDAVDALVRSKNRTSRQREPDSTSPLPPSQHVEPINEESLVNNEALSPTERGPRRNVAVGQPSATVNSQEPQLLGLAHSNDASVSSRGSTLPQINWISDSEYPNALVGNLSGQTTPQGQNQAWSFGPLELNFPIDHLFSVPMPTETVTVTSPRIFAETILHACKKHVNLRNSELDIDPMISHDLATYGIPKENQDMDHIAQIAAIGVHMLAAFAGLELYIYGVGAAAAMESVLRWRLMPTRASRAAIPEPFRPTPLQYSTSDYPHVVDFINWPAIRDQLILQSQTVNIDEIVRTVVQNTVVEIPHRRMSVNVLSLFYNSTANTSNYSAWNNNLKSSITDSQWKYLEVPAPSEPDFNSSNVDSTPAESALVKEISRRMDTGSNPSSPEGNSRLSTIDTTSASPHSVHLPAVTDNLTGSWSTAAHQRNDIVTRFGLDQVTKWKLSKDFARNHPFLDCSSAVTAYDMVSAQVALEAEARVAEFIY